MFVEAYKRQRLEVQKQILLAESVCGGVVFHVHVEVCICNWFDTKQQGHTARSRYLYSSLLSSSL